MTNSINLQVEYFDDYYYYDQTTQRNVEKGTGDSFFSFKYDYEEIEGINKILSWQYMSSYLKLPKEVVREFDRVRWSE